MPRPVVDLGPAGQSCGPEARWPHGHYQQTSARRRRLPAPSSLSARCTANRSHRASSGAPTPQRGSMPLAAAASRRKFVARGEPPTSSPSTRRSRPTRHSASRRPAAGSTSHEGLRSGHQRPDRRQSRSLPRGRCAGHSPARRGVAEPRRSPPSPDLAPRPGRHPCLSWQGSRSARHHRS